ncbi:MAG: hypothetical protein ABR534_04175 [Desulfotignum sp.]|nr:type II secretion system protein M [Desulfobacteraceae bacterium]
MKHLSTREKNTIVLGSLLTLVFLAVQFIYLPLVDKKKDLERISRVEQETVRQMVQLHEQYRDLTGEPDMEQTILAARPRDFTLFSFLDSEAEKSGVKKNIDYMRPFSQDMDDGTFLISKVRLKLKNLYLNDFIDFIKGVETSDYGVSVISLSLSRTGDQATMLEAVLEARTLVQKEPL